MYSVEALTRRTTIGSIQLYQQYLSPRKGFACPHRVLYRESSCSDYVKDVFLNSDLRSAIQLSIHRFRSCGAATQQLRLKNQGGCIVIPCCIPL
jgi:putative component of membrane protein insertase Oxa1/YidC/SpoIIIJ protein YidD